MRATLGLGRWLGIPVRVHWSVLVIAGLLAYGLTGGVTDALLWVVVVPTVAIFLASLLAHELAHSVVARRNGVEVRGITLWLLGGVAQLGGTIPSAGAQLRIAAAGPATSFVLAAGFLGLSAAAPVLGLHDLVVQALEWLAFVNVVLGTFNLIPAAPLDGGRILAGALWAIGGDRTRAEVAATRAGQGFGILLIAGGVLGPLLDLPFFSIWTVIMGLFLFRVAGLEQRHARLAGRFADLRVRDVMTPGPETVRGWSTVAAYAHEWVAAPPGHRVYPVVGWDGAIVGVVTLERLARVPTAERGSLRVQDVAFPVGTVVVTTPDEPLLAVAARLDAGAVPVALVLDGPVLVGIVTPSDLARVARAPIAV